MVLQHLFNDGRNRLEGFIQLGGALAAGFGQVFPAPASAFDDDRGCLGDLARIQPLGEVARDRSDQAYLLVGDTAQHDDAGLEMRPAAIQELPQRPPSPCTPDCAIKRLVLQVPHVPTPQGLVILACKGSIEGIQAQDSVGLF